MSFKFKKAASQYKCLHKKISVLIPSCVPSNPDDVKIREGYDISTVDWKCHYV